MDKYLEEIALNMILQSRNYDVAQLVREFLELLSDETLREKGREFSEKTDECYKNAKDAFWEAFKYPIQIFDLNKNELPDECELVIVFDELSKDWFHSELFRLTDDTPYFAFEGAYLSNTQAHRWTQLPILEKEK